MVVNPEKTAAGEASEATPLLQTAAPIVSPQACYQHQILLRCFLNLKNTVTKATGLFKTEYNYEIKSEVDPIARQSMVEERRWSIYISRAVYRFSVWWAQLPADSEVSSREASIVSEKPCARHSGWAWTGDELPPLDVLMVFHALTLHHRSFGEDCFRHKKMALWNEGFPLQLVSQCIDPGSLTYSCPEPCKLRFESMTKLAWNNLDDAEGVPIECPRCQNRTVVPWSTRRRKGLAEELLQYCQSCKYGLGNHVLVVRKLRQDLLLLLRRDLPLPGTCWSVEEKHGTLTPKKAPNEFVKRYLMSMLLEETRPTNLFPNISQTIESLGRTVVKPALPMIHDIFEHYQYVENSSCNLRAAVTRVLESASAMQDTNLSETDFDTPHMVTQYIAFLRGQGKGFLSWDPDLSEIDLTDPTMWVWSTHLLTPRSYSEFFRRVGNGLPVDWQPPHSPKCSLCRTLRPPSFARRFFQGLVSLSAWKEFMEAAA
ncbi:uncharacterized protein BO88DRAFT_484618 [Aspergillus vadensis CBS 113365]|uniref:Uncharacterized protein n=1 Tax=Aspergillus vadensis (strain CBS 113365 / IMI 142717 / IBT 24658) TaxID=1448311 RepID=A0A319BRE8_ASPVC|nr:hypothetical protein BO88DRAFT_484618 [Aspergillus vadensis CBS 113365]PYH73730.1 hypothetical protein BO88DRAFT_484618 [Aspergillus vadensis CBS 113365]